MTATLALQRLGSAWVVGLATLATTFRPKIVVDGLTLDRHVQAMMRLARQNGGGGANGPAMDLSSLRRAMAVMPELMGVEREASITTRDFAVANGAPVPLRLYEPPRVATPSGLLVFLHGGGWIAGSVDTYDRLCRHIAARAGIRLVSVDYRLAPEHPFPAAIDDAEAAFDWVMRQTGAWGVDPARVAIGGDSAGAALATAVCVARAAEAKPPPRLLWLLYPALDLVTEHESLRQMDGYVFTRAALEWIVDRYVPDGQDRADPRLSPGLGEVAGLPSAHILVAGFDPLRDQGIAFANRLGDRATLVVAEGLTHGFADMAGVVPKARVALDGAVAALSRAVGF